MHCFANCHSFECIWTHDKICLLVILGGWSWTSSLNITHLSQDTQWTEKPSEFIKSRSLAWLLCLGSKNDLRPCHVMLKPIPFDKAPICCFFYQKWVSCETPENPNALSHHSNADAGSVKDTEFKLWDHCSKSTTEVLQSVQSSNITGVPYGFDWKLGHCKDRKVGYIKYSNSSVLGLRPDAERVSKRWGECGIVAVRFTKATALKLTWPMAPLSWLVAGRRKVLTRFMSSILCISLSQNLPLV